MERILDFVDTCINSALPTKANNEPSPTHPSPKHTHTFNKGLKPIYIVVSNKFNICPICVFADHSLSRCPLFLGGH